MTRARGWRLASGLLWAVSGVCRPLWAGQMAGGLAHEARMYRQQGFEAQQSGDVHDAIAKYQKAVLLDPSYATAYNDLGVGYEAIGELARAKQAYLRCLELNPRYAGAYANLAMLYERQGDFDTAVVYWQRRVELGDPQDPWTHKARERVAELLNKRPTEQLTTLSPEQIPSSAGVAHIPRVQLPVVPSSSIDFGSPMMQKSPTELEIDVGRLTQELAKSYFDLGVAYTELKAYPRAIDAFEKSLALNPMQAQAHANLGLLYKHVQNDPEKASRHLRTYLQLNPNAKDREELEALLALLQRSPPSHASPVPPAALGGSR